MVPSRPRLRQLRRAALTALVLCASTPAAAQGATLVVDKDSIGGRCDDTRSASSVTVTAPWCSLNRALTAAPAGSTVLLRTASHPASAVKGKTRTDYVTFRPYGSEAVSVNGLTLEDSNRIRVERLRFTSRLTVGVGSQDVAIVGSELTGQGLSMRVARNILIEGNWIHDLTYDGVSGGAGYGVWLNGSWSDPNRPQGISDVVIRNNVFERIPADGIQMGTVENVLVEGNRFTEIRPFLDPTEHSDAIQMFGTSKNVTISRNVFHDNTRGLIAKGRSYPGLVIENNLMVRLAGTALNIYDAPGVRIVNNTIWDTPLGLRFRDLPEVPEAMDGAVVANNIVQSFEFSPNQVALEDHNLIGRRLDWQRYGIHDDFGSPSFVAPGAIDYRLTADSAGVDAAHGDLAPSTDRAGFTRTDLQGVTNRGSGVPAFADIGAHETQVAGPAPQPSPEITPKPAPETSPAPTPEPGPEPEATPHAGPGTEIVEVHAPEDAEEVEPHAHAAKLQLRRASVLPGSAELDVYAPITAYASGSVEVSLRAAGKTVDFTEPVDAEQRHVRFRRALDRSQARMGTGIITLRYAGDRDTRGQEVRLRAARGKARLEPQRPTLADGRLRAEGTLSARARGVVRVQLGWVSGGQRQSLEVHAKIEDGEWRLDENLPEDTLLSIQARTGSLHSYILFTGYLPERMRGEMRSFEMLGPPAGAP